MTDRPLSLVPLQTNPEKDREFIVQAAEELLARAKDGKIHSLCIIWDDADEGLKSSTCCAKRWSIIGMLEIVKAGMIIERL